MIMTDDPMHVVMPRQVQILISFSFPGHNEMIYGAVGIIKQEHFLCRLIYACLLERIIRIV